MPRLDVNILPGRYKKSRMRRGQVLMIVAGLIAICGVAWTYQLASAEMDRASDLRSQLAALDQQLELRDERIAQRNELVGLTLEYDAIMDKQEVIMEDITAINGAAEQSGIGLLSMQHGGSGGEVKFLCTGYPNINDYIEHFENFREALEGTGRFSEIVIPDPTAPAQLSVEIKLKAAH